MSCDHVFNYQDIIGPCNHLRPDCWCKFEVTCDKIIGERKTCIKCKEKEEKIWNYK